MIGGPSREAGGHEPLGATAPPQTEAHPANY